MPDAGGRRVPRTEGRRHSPTDRAVAADGRTLSAPGTRSRDEALRLLADVDGALGGCERAAARTEA